LVNGRAADFLAPLLPDAAQEIATSLHLDSAMAAQGEQADLMLSSDHVRSTLKADISRRRYVRLVPIAT